MKTISDKTILSKAIIKCDIIAQKELSFDDLFEEISDFQQSFFVQIRTQVEQVLFKNWRTCGGAKKGRVEYETVETSCLSDEIEHYDLVIVDYYAGTIDWYGRTNKYTKLSVNLSIS